MVRGALIITVFARTLQSNKGDGHQVLDYIGVTAFRANGLARMAFERPFVPCTVMLTKTSLIILAKRAYFTVRKSTTGIVFQANVDFIRQMKSW
jgi:hypothetical protein